MQEKEYDADGEIKKILDKISAENNKDTDNENIGDVEFEIGIDMSEPEEAPDAEVPEQKEESSKTEKEVSPPLKEEFKLPDVFDVIDGENIPSLTDDMFKIRTVYIPRFTDASDDYHRLGFIPERQDSQGKSSTNQKKDEKIDAVAEIDSGLTPDAKIVEVSQEEKQLIDDSTSTVFKFESPERKNTDTSPSAEYEIPSEPKKEASEVKKEIPEAKNPITEPVEKELPADSLPPIEEKQETKLPEKYIPTNVAVREDITEIGDEVSENQKKEYSSGVKRDGFKDRFLDTLMSQKVRFFVALAISLFVLVFENLIVFGMDLISILKLDANPEALAIIDLQCVMGIAVLGLPEIIKAVKNAFSKRFSTELFIMPALLAYILYTVTVIIKKQSGYSMLGLVPAVLILTSILSAHYRTKADFTAFKLISCPGDKKIVDNKYTRSLERENIALDGLVEEYKSKTARVFKTAFVADFFRRTRKTSEGGARILFLSLIPLGAALITGLVTFFVYDGLISFVTSFASVYLFSLPVFAVLVRKLPHYRASLSANQENGAVIGEGTMFEYAGVDVVCFDDTDIFGEDDVSIQRIMLYGNNENLDKALRQMSALFVNVGGPLDIIFSDSLDRRCTPANGISIHENGIIGEIDGKKVMAGTYEFMVSEGALVPQDEDIMKKSLDSTKIMYAAENGTVYAKFYIRYRFSEEFTMLMPSLKDDGIIPLVYTRDPNINNELLRALTAGMGVIRILKKNTTPMRDFAPSKISAGMVSNGDKSNLVNLITLTKRYTKLNAKLFFTERIAMIAGAIAGIVISLCNISVLPSLIPSLWHVAWSFALLIVSVKFFKLPKKKKENKKNAE